MIKLRNVGGDNNHCSPFPFYDLREKTFIKASGRQEINDNQFLCQAKN